MTTSHNKLGLLLGFIGMCLFAGTLPATRLALSGSALGDVRFVPIADISNIQYHLAVRASSVGGKATLGAFVVVS
jgi:hypothetical protein